MSSSSSNSPGPADASEPRSTEPSTPQDAAANPLEAQAVETFEIEVSAGRPSQTETPNLAEPPAIEPRAPASRSDDNSLGVTANLPTERAAPASVKKSKPQPAALEFPPKVNVPPKEPSPPLSARRVGRQFSWWMTSLGLHVLLLVILAFSTLAVMQEEQLELYASPAISEMVEEFQDLEIDPTEDLESLDEELNAELDSPDPDTLAELSSETLLQDPTPIGESASADVSNSLSELGQLFGDNGTGMSGMDDAIGTGEGGAMAKFFGTEIKAKRILYMLDNSGGMRKGGKFESLVSELQTSVRDLDIKQQFYVIFYSDTVYPLFFPHSVRNFVKPTDRNLKTLDLWLDSVELCGGNAIDEALAAAEVIRPDVIFLLTDGDLFTTEKKKALLLNRMGRSYSIHTFGLGVGEQTNTAAGLKQVAEANEGIFRAIKVTDEMKSLAKAKERPYHKDKPGPVWGIKVGGR